MKNTKQDEQHRMICLRVYLQDKKQAKLVRDAAKRSQKTTRPNVSRFVREAALEKAELIARDGEAA